MYLYHAYGLKSGEFNKEEFNMLRFYIAEKIQSGPIAEKYFVMLSKLGNIKTYILEVVGYNRGLWPNMKQVDEIINNGEIVRSFD